MTGRWLWIGALALTLSALGVDSARRLRDIEAVTATRVGTGLEPEVDASSPSGYRWGEHRLVLPETDSYPWLLQAERSLADGAIRIRVVDYDNAPVGREVHWAGFERWWALGLTGLYQLTHPGLTGPQALERVAPWANTALLVVFLVALAPLVAARFGALPAALLAFGCVAVFPFFDNLRLGNFDHHGAAILSCLVAVLLLVAGGAGWVRSAEVEPARSSAERRALWSWLPTSRSARRWFIASGFAAGGGLWISAATMTPVLIGMGLGALLGVGVSARGSSGNFQARLEPGLFRAWGRAGAAASFGLYLIEYFPGHLGMRLEVNHPLYSLAFLGGGDLIARAVPLLAGPTQSRGQPPARSALGWIAADLATILALPAVVLVTRAATFRLSDPVLWTFHNRYINEFLGLATRMQTMAPSQVVGHLSLVVLVALPIAALLWPNALAGGWRIGWRALLLVVVGGAGAYAYIVFLGLARGSHVAGVVGAAAAVTLWFLLPLSRRPPALAPPFQAALLLVSLPALVMLLLSLAQERWLGIAAALWLGAVVVMAAVLRITDHPLNRTGVGRALAAALALLVLGVAPGFALREPYSPPNVALITRDASLWLRRRLGADAAVILAGPSATTDMIWFGGFRGIGTLYWENLEGLRASAEICGAPDPASARSLLVRHGVTHVAAYAWDGGLEQLQRSIEAAPSDVAWPRLSGRPIQEMCSHEPRDVPVWLVPLPYVPPRVGGYAHPVVRLYEVVDDLPPEVALVRLARYYQALRDPRMEEALGRSLELRPTVPALAMMAQLQNARGERPGSFETVERLRGELERPGRVQPEDRFEAAIALALARDGQGASRQLAAALDQADEKVLRRLSPERLALLVDLSRQLGLERVHPDPIAAAVRLLSGG
ncbi:MAG: hypothetical protein EXR95_01405 [Gemmatimonadetes bacterium]|nr:hypothetical protein [Gemmatimonadota bacterium]